MVARILGEDLESPALGWSIRFPLRWTMELNATPISSVVMTRSSMDGETTRSRMFWGWVARSRTTFSDASVLKVVMALLEAVSQMATWRSASEGSTSSSSSLRLPSLTLAAVPEV